MSEAEQRIAEIAARAEKATAGPWHLFGGGGYVSVGSKQQCDVLEKMPGASYGPGWNQNSNNLHFCAEARADIPWLLEQLKQARAALALGPGGAHE